MYVDVKAGQLGWRRVYQLCIGFVNPRPIALVSTVSPEGRPNLAPFSFYNMVSANPPVLIVCPAIRRDGTIKDTLRNIQATGQFVVAAVTPQIVERAVACGAELPYGDSEFDFSDLTPVPATQIQPALVVESPANIECGLHQIVRLGNEPGAGNVVFGDILALHVADDVLDAGGLAHPHRLQTVGRLGADWYCNVSQPYELHIPPPPK
jgi:flavin reductase (DIM6/NTAB) family NADH-FMN oxidoreductase RutF